MPERAPHSHENHTAHWLMLGGAGLLGSVIAAPYVLPLLGIGRPEMAGDIMHFVGGTAGSGLAGAAQTGLSHVPLVGSALTSGAAVTIPGIGVTIAAGALTTLAASAIIGIGGSLLANWMERHEDPNAKIHWSKIVRIAALSTSALISLPSMLSGISIGITFLAAALSPLWGSYASVAMQHSLGSTAMSEASMNGAGALSGFMSMLPHLFTCGPALLPVLLGAFIGKKAEHHAGQDSASSKPGYKAELVSATPTANGERCQLAFRLRDEQTGNILSADALAITHTQKLHTMLIDSTLNDYQHLHPVYDPNSGLFTCSFTPATTHHYAAWHDFTTAEGTHITCKNELPCQGPGMAPAPLINTASKASADGISIQVVQESPLRCGEDSMLHIQVTHADGSPVRDLEPIMGAKAHLVGFSRDGQHFVHSHPLRESGGDLQFHLHPEHEGPTRFFIQLRPHGQEVTVPFGLRILPPQQFTRREAVREAHVHTHAFAV